MNVQEVVEFLSGEQLGVLSTARKSGQPRSSLMGFAVTPEMEIIFDTVRSARKYPILKENPRVAWVIGCTTEVTVQYEGEAKELEGEELAKYKKVYFAKFNLPNCREGLMQVKVGIFWEADRATSGPWIG